MASSVIRGVVAFLAAVAITSPALASFQGISNWLNDVPQPSAMMLFVIAIGGLLVGRFASRQRRDP